MDYSIEIDESRLRIIGDHSGPGVVSCHLFYKDFKVTQFDIKLTQDGSFKFGVLPSKASDTYDDDTVIWMIETAFFDNCEDELVDVVTEARKTSRIADLEEMRKCK